MKDEIEQKQETVALHRPGSSLLQRQRDWYRHTENSKIPYRTLVEDFGPDGASVTRSSDVNYAGATFDAYGQLNGGIVVVTRFAGSRRTSTINIENR